MVLLAMSAAGVFLVLYVCTSSNQSGPMSSLRKRDFLPVTRLRRCV